LAPVALHLLMGRRLAGQRGGSRRGVGEPLGALDPQTARDVLAVAQRRARTLVVISQE